MRDLDGTPIKARLGANALIGTSMARALAASVAAEGHCTGLGDEGGFAPNLAEPEEVLQVIVDVIDDAGYPTGRQGVGIALDPAASEFFSDGGYKVNGQQLSSDDMIARYAAMIDAFPIWSIKDGLGEQEPTGWQRLTAKLGDRVQLVGDDNFCTSQLPSSAAATLAGCEQAAGRDGERERCSRRRPPGVRRMAGRSTPGHRRAAGTALPGL